MGYSIIWDKAAINSLRKLEPFVAKRINSLIKEFSNDTSSKDVKRLRGMNYYRLRAGDYRVIIRIEQSDKKIFIIKLGHRKNIYDR